MKKNVLMVLDEFSNLGRLENLESMVTVGAGYGMEILLASQDRASIEEVWGNTTNTFFANTNVRVFNLGRMDGKTASSVAEVIGSKTAIATSKSSSESENNKNQGESFSQTSQKLMDTSEILEMGTNAMLCMLRSQKPLILNRIISHEHPAYKHKLDKPPLALK